MNNNIDHPNAPAAKQISAQRLMQIKAEIAKLKQKVEHRGGVKLALVDRLERYSNKLKTNLASFAETDFIKNLLLQMLKDLDTREEVLDTGFFFFTNKPSCASTIDRGGFFSLKTTYSPPPLFFRTALSTTEAELADHKAKLVNYEKELVEHFFLFFSQKPSIRDLTH
jgi:hypothetical protein